MKNNSDVKVEKSKKVKDKSGIPFYRKQSFKHSGTATILLAIFFVCIVLFNILATNLSNKISALKYDLTSSKDYSISDENVKYIKAVQKKVKIIFTTTEKQYTTDYVTSLAEYYTDSTGGKYFDQTVKMVKKYAQLNSNISVQFIDSSTPAFEEYKDKYSDETLYYGDIIVESTFTNSAGVEQTRHKILTFDDIYTSEDTSGYAQYGYDKYYITGNKVESVMTSALYYVIQEQQDKVTVLTGYGCSKTDDLQTLLKSNNYDFTEIKDLSISDIPKDTTILMLAAPTTDLSDNDVKKIDTFLLKSGYGKGLVYFASSSQPSLPNIDALMSEWGMEFGTGTLYETDTTKFATGDHTTMVLQDAGSDLTTDLGSNLNYISTKIRPMTLKYKQNGKYNAYEIVKSSDTTVVMPRGAADDWSDDMATQKGSFTTVALSTYATEDPKDSSKALTSSILGIAAVDFSYSEKDYSNISNNEVMLKMINKLANRSADTYTFADKVIDQASFTASQAKTLVVKWIFIGFIPVCLIVTGIVVFVRRKRR